MTEGDFQELFREHKTAVYQFAWRMTGSTSAAEDITQEVFLSAWRGEVHLDRTRGSWRTLLLAVARHAAWKRWRREEVYIPLENDVLLQAPSYDHLDAQEALARAVAALPPLQREALVLATFHEQSLQEIADAVGAEVGTVKARLHRARESLKAMLATYKPGSVATGRKYGAVERP